MQPFATSGKSSRVLVGEPAWTRSRHWPLIDERSGQCRISRADSARLRDSTDAAHCEYRHG